MIFCDKVTGLVDEGEAVSAWTLVKCLTLFPIAFSWRSWNDHGWDVCTKSLTDRTSVQHLHPTYKLESAVCLSLLELIQGN